MKRLILFVMIFVIALPVLAQSLDEIYTFDVTGTQIEYSSDWDFELTDDLLIFSGDGQQVIVVDYPFVNLLLLEAEESSLEFLVEVIANEVTGDEIDPDDIYTFDIDGREVAAYDIQGLQVPGSVYALEFSNGGIGMLISFNIREQTENSMLESFDNTDAIVDNVSVENERVRENPSVYLFQSDGRVIAPAEWSVSARLNGDLEYAIVTSPDEDVTVILLDLSEFLTSGIALEDVIEESELDWRNDYDVRFENDDPEPYQLGDREAISYTIEISTLGDNTEGQLIIFRFSNDAIVAAIVYGEIDDYEAEISLILGSFNYLGATLEFIN